MTLLRTLRPYRDEQGNEIVFDGLVEAGIWIRIRGTNNRVVISSEARIKGLRLYLDSNNGLLEIGPSSPDVASLTAYIRVGEDSAVRLGRNVSSTSQVVLSATEGTQVVVGDDVMFASGNQVRADDEHAIFDVRTGDRVNVSRSISIGDHVWFGAQAVVLAGVTIGEGTVVGFRSLVTRSLPNNCVAVGTPARVTRRDIAWERPHLALPPYYRPDASTVTKSPYWNLTRADGPTVVALRRGMRRRLVRLARRLGRR